MTDLLQDTHISSCNINLSYIEFGNAANFISRGYIFFPGIPQICVLLHHFQYYAQYPGAVGMV